MSPITLRLNSVEKRQVFWPWSSLRMSAWTVPRTFSCTHLRKRFSSRRSGARPSVAWNSARRWSMAVLRNMARMAGAGPLMVIETEVRG